MTNAIITAYCATCTICCGPNPSGINAAGKAPIEGISIAGPRSVPLGTIVRVQIPGLMTNNFKVDDRTARRYDGRWDVFIASHQRAKVFGRQRGTVTIINLNK